MKIQNKQDDYISKYFGGMQEYTKDVQELKQVEKGLNINEGED